MCTFKFNFSTDRPESEENEKPAEISSKEEKIAEAKEAFPGDRMLKNFDDIVEKANVFSCGDLQIGHVLPGDARKYLEQDERFKDSETDIGLADELHSDLIEGKYEGGLKIWECTTDLADYICEQDSIEWKNATVLDLGCGTGILGMIAFMNGARVHFQDYNEEVLIASTIPNVLLNVSEEERDSIGDRCRFFSGDWSSLTNLMNADSDEHKYDFILTSETIYNPKNYDKICNLIKSRLKPSGCVYVAAKTYYFGVGGNMRDFEKCATRDGVLKSEVCWKNQEGVPREILKLSFK